MRLVLRFLGFLFTAGTIIFLVSVAGVAGVLWHYSKELPDYSALQNYEPAVMTRVHAADGSLLAEYAHERRLYIPIQAVPKLVTDAFIAAEDKNFYEHNGIDPQGIMRAVVFYIQNYGSGRRPQGASTITQQVAKNFLLTPETTVSRKIREALLALKIERTFSKEKILELYLNEIYLGMSAYGVAAASLLYFDKSVHELTIPEAAYLAALPKGPNNYNPYRKHDDAVARRNYVIDRMAEDHYITAQEAEQAKKEPLKVTPRPTGARIFAAEYFAEEVRRYIADNYGEQKLYEGGLSVRTTLEPKLQQLARKVLADGLVKFDETQGYHGVVTKLDLGSGEWGAKLADVRALADVAPWRLAVVLDSSDQSARVGLQPAREPAGAVGKERETGSVPLEAVKWARSSSVRTVTKVSQVLQPGDVVYVEPLAGKEGQFRLRQIPEISGAIMAMDPYTGRVLAMVGGFSYDESQFNRATQALRQPGSSFKPIVYSAALDNGYTPSSILLDGPLEIDTGSGIWRPENYEQNYLGPSTLRTGIEHSRNLMTVRLAQDIGMPLIGEYAKRFGVYDSLPPYLSYALGAGETTLMRMVGAYAMFDNGGRKIAPTLIDRIQDRYGHTVYKHDQRECRGCDASGWSANQNEPTLIDKRERVLDAMTAYQITSILEGVPIRGTAAASGIKELGKHIAGKTGTTSDEKDVWFIGFSPDLVVGVFMGYDKPRHIADRATGGALAAPIFRDFMKVALADKPAIPFKVPVGIKLIRVELKSGMRATPGDQRVILEAFKPGTAPPDPYSVIGVNEQEGAPSLVVPAGAQPRGLY